MSLDQLPAVAARERIVPGHSGHWFIGPGGIARLKPSHVTVDGGLVPAAERSLRSRGLFETRPLSAYALTVLTTTSCNLGCGYCFQNVAADPSGGSRPPRIARSRLTSATITKILTFTEARMAEAGLTACTVLLFGGEPLLNPRGCEELLRRADGIGLQSASMISNATLLTPALAQRLAELKLRSVQVTFDGDRDDHDAVRVKHSGAGTFDEIIHALRGASAVSDLRWTLRVNVSHKNYARVDALIERLADSLDPTRCRVYFARVGDVGIGYGNELAHDEAIADRFSAWHRRAIDLGFGVQRPSAAQVCQTCGYRDGRYGAVVNADGALSSCWDTAGKPEWRVGTITDGYLPAEATEGRWISCQDAHQLSASASAIRSFHDAVDGAVLDHLRHTGRL